jgi:hypothetical protein
MSYREKYLKYKNKYMELRSNYMYLNLSDRDEFVDKSNSSYKNKYVFLKENIFNNILENRKITDFIEDKYLPTGKQFNNILEKDTENKNKYMELRSNIYSDNQIGSGRRYEDLPPIIPIVDYVKLPQDERIFYDHHITSGDVYTKIKPDEVKKVGFIEAEYKVVQYLLERYGSEVRDALIKVINSMISVITIFYTEKKYHQLILK